MTTALSRISERVRNGAKAWYENAGVPAGPDGKRDQAKDDEKAFENLKLMAGLLAEGVSKAEVASLQLLFSANPNVSVASVIKIARDKRNDPAIAPVLKFLKETLLPQKATTKVDGTYDSEKEKELEAAEKARALAASKLLYDASAIAHVLHQSIVPGSTNFKQEVQSAQDRYERDLGRKLNDDEKFE